ncbi:MAG TPA: hypothetical protein VFT22_31690, partial [Kofleriaceae bacterium]|nr:hypothetical protein [Kofleriaceae bacterium]
MVEPLATPAGGRRWLLRSPSPGWFRPAVVPATWCAPGAQIGTLDVLGRAHRLVTPIDLSGFAGSLPSGEASVASSLASRAVAYRDPLAILSSDLALAGASADVASEPAAGDAA